MNKKELIKAIIENNSDLGDAYETVADEIDDLVNYPGLFDLDMEGIKEDCDYITDEATLFGFASRAPETIGGLVVYLILDEYQYTAAIDDVVDGSMIYNSDLWEWLGAGDNEKYVENYLREYGYNGESFFELVRLAHDDLLTDGLNTVIDDLINAGIQQQ